MSSTKSSTITRVVMRNQERRRARRCTTSTLVSVLQRMRCIALLPASNEKRGCPLRLAASAQSTALCCGEVLDAHRSMLHSAATPDTRHKLEMQ